MKSKYLIIIVVLLVVVNGLVYFSGAFNKPSATPAQEDAYFYTKSEINYEVSAKAQKYPMSLSDGKNIKFRSYDINKNEMRLEYEFTSPDMTNEKMDSKDKGGGFLSIYASEVCSGRLEYSILRLGGIIFVGVANKTGFGKVYSFDLSDCQKKNIHPVINIVTDSVVKTRLSDLQDLLPTKIAETVNISKAEYDPKTKTILIYYHLTFNSTELKLKESFKANILPISLKIYDYCSLDLKEYYKYGVEYEPVIEYTDQVQEKMRITSADCEIFK